MTDEAGKKRFLTWKLARRVFIGLFIVGVIGFIAVALWVASLARDLPSHERLASYEPPITSRVHAGDGTLIAEFAEEHRVFVPIESIPRHVVEAFVAAEDKKFFNHHGLDYMGILRGAINSAKIKLTGGGNLQGGSTITQQVAKNMLLTRDQTIQRKVKEAIIARRMENTFTKDEILELYLNEIYLGVRAYGVGSAALIYFDKSLPELDLSEAAILASLAKAPSTVNPYRRPERLLARRNYVLSRMVEDGYITEEEAEAAKAKPLTTKQRLRGPEYAAATYFVQELRKQLIDQYGEEALQRGGLSIRSTIDTRLQLAAQEALQSGLETYDRRHGYRGPFASIDPDGNVPNQLDELSLPPGYGTWEAGMIASVSDSGATVVLNDARRTSIPKEDVEWARSWTNPDTDRKGLSAGDVILVEVERIETRRPGAEDDSDADDSAEDDWIYVPAETAILRQVPDVEGAIVALDPHTGRVLAMVGGYSFFRSPFNRVTQAKRQPGSSFKPFVYATALENGYTPSTRILDAPFVYYDETIDEVWKPENYSEGRSYGEVTMRTALERSFNQVTARVAVDVGMEAISELAERFGLYDDLPPYPAMALGSGETSPWRMARGYAAFVNGGKEVTPTLLDRVQDRHGNTLYKHDTRDCEGCKAEEWDGDRPPALPDNREQLIDPVIAYQIVHMLEGVVERGTARRARRVGKPLAGKTGTTNDYMDALFYGFSPDLVVGIWVGFDTPKSLGVGEAGGSVGAPIFTDFMEKALEDEPALPFRIPPGVRLVQVDHDTGDLPTAATSQVIVEAFRPGTEPGARFDEDEPFSISGNTRVSNDRQDIADPLEEGVMPPEGEEGRDDVAEENLGGIY